MSLLWQIYEYRDENNILYFNHSNQIMLSLFKNKVVSPDIYTVAFYNLENLFDTLDDPKTLDDDFTPKGRKHWSLKRYKRKLKKISHVIASIGRRMSDHPPALIGLVEVENKQVLRDLVQTKKLKNHNYGIVHYDSPDERGIDVALLYKKTLFELQSSETFPLMLIDEDGQRDYTRDILLVKGLLNGELVHVLVNHWPSRRSGNDKTETKRIKAAQTASHILEAIENDFNDSKIIVMGDFNDDPRSPSVKKYLAGSRLMNPMESLNDKGKGSINHKNHWHLFDQILFSRNFFNKQKGKHSFKYADVFDRHFLKEWHGKYKGNPFKTYAGKQYLGGFSDHFPVFVFLKLN